MPIGDAVGAVPDDDWVVEVPTGYEHSIVGDYATIEAAVLEPGTPFVLDVAHAT